MKTSIHKKIKLATLSKRLGDSSFAEGKILKELDRKIEDTRSLIPSPVNVDPIYREIGFVKGMFNSLNDVISDLKKIVESLASEKAHKDDIESVKSDIINHKKDIESELEKVKRMTGRGGSMPRKISLGGSVTAQRYADINWIGSGITLSAVNNDTAKRTDITITSGGSGFQAPLTGGLTGTNTWTTAPNVIVVDQGRAMQKVSTDGTVNWTVSGSGPFTTVLTVNPTFDIYSPS